MGILGFHQPLDFDLEFVKRAVSGEGMGDIAEGILMLVELAIARQVCDVQ